MTTYCLEMRSTENWSEDVRYRSYTQSETKALAFEKVPKIQFTDSGHGIVPSVRTGRHGPEISTLQKHVSEHLPSLMKTNKVPSKPVRDERKRCEEVASKAWGKWHPKMPGSDMEKFAAEILNGIRFPALTQDSSK